MDQLEAILLNCPILLCALLPPPAQDQLPQLQDHIQVLKFRMQTPDLIILLLLYSPVFPSFSARKFESNNFSPIKKTSTEFFGRRIVYLILQILKNEK